MSNSCEATRVPGLIFSSTGSSRSFSSGSRYSVTTSASEKSDAKMSPRTNSTATPCSCALRFDSSTMSGLNSMPRARAPRFAAAMAILPSPEPRSTRVSPAFTCAMSSMRSTTLSGVGIQITSLPDCPRIGL